MQIKDRLHDLRSAFEDWRNEQEKARAERTERRLMKTSTWDALMESIGPVVDGDSQVVHEDLLRDTIAVEKRRWIERVQWIVLALITAGLGWTAGWYMQPAYAPDPIKCNVIVHGVGEEPSVVRCEGVPE